ncbi:MAG: FemAB family PEP-CTERM system-associated protein [Acidobacteriota bacterium]|nr:FemAB family PEP-CTERM system-associated protein [Acidobacteriota bacterium]
MEIILAGNQQQSIWDEFVEQHATATHCHRFGWKRVLEDSLGLRTFYLMAMSAGRVTGILPLAWQKSFLFGSFLTSLPHLNAGGVLAESGAVEDALVARAIELADENRAARIQLRYRSECRLSWPINNRKVSAVREVSRDTEAMWKAISSNNRRKVNKATRTGMTAEAEGAEALDIFYRIYADNMRNLGTPVYPRSFFAEVLRNFAASSEIVVVRLHGEPIAAAWLNGFRDGVEATWMCSLWKYLQLQPNMMLYWHILRIAGERGYRMFDFGRSTRDSGTHKFKQLWDTTDVELPWANWTAEGAVTADLSPANPKYQLATKLWAKLPLPVANFIGPHIVRNLP